MPNVQSSGERLLSLRETLIDFIAAFKGSYATQVLSDLGRDRPKLDVRYLELDHKIQKMLQTMLDEAGYPHVTIQSVENDPRNPHDYPYTYLLVPRDQDGEWAKKYLPNVFSALLKATLTSDIDLAYNPEKRLAFIKLKPNNRFHVQGVGHGIE